MLNVITCAHICCGCAASMCTVCRRMIALTVVLYVCRLRLPVHSFRPSSAPCICELKESLLLALLQQAHIRLAPHCRRQCVPSRGKYFDDECHCGYKDGCMRTEIGPILRTCTSAALDVSCYSRYLTTVRKRLVCDMLLASTILGNVAFILGTFGFDTSAAGGSSGGMFTGVLRFGIP